MKYDGILFGNGMTLNLLKQIKPFIPETKQYLLDIDDFLKCWINNEITNREERIFYSSIYGNRSDRWKYFEKLKNDVREYYGKYDTNIERVLGELLGVKSEEKEIITFFPAIYNIWYIILNDYLEYLNLEPKIRAYYKSVKSITGCPQYIWTTNFDLFGESIDPEHIHGRFLTKMRKYEDVVYKLINGGESYYFKYIWGHNGIGKKNNIEQLRRYFDFKEYFDFDFFYNNDIQMDKLLIYGMGFKQSGFVKDLKTAYSKYEQPTLGAIIDEHILLRIREMQDSAQLNELHVTCFDDVERRYLTEVLKEMKVQSYTLIKCNRFNFSINY